MIKLTNTKEQKSPGRPPKPRFLSDGAPNLTTSERRAVEIEVRLAQGGRPSAVDVAAEVGITARAIRAFRQKDSYIKACESAATHANQRRTAGSREYHAICLENGVSMTTTTIHISAELLNAVREAANRRSMRRINGHLVDGHSSRPSASEIIVDLLTHYRKDLDHME